MDNLLANLKAVMQSTPQRFQQFVEIYPDDLIRRQPKEGEWSALECLVHLIDTDRDIFSVRVKTFMAGEKEMKAFFPDEEGTKLTDDVTAADLLQQFNKLRTENLKLIDTITDADLSRTAVHSELGEITLSQLLHEWGGHDLMHTVQAEQAMIQPFIAGCEPWKEYFATHIAR